MKATSMTIKAPGKLMIAGEYAVLEKLHTLVAMAVDRFVYATIESGQGQTLFLEDLQLLDVEWTFDHGTLVLNHDDPRVRFVKQAMSVTLQYLEEKGVTITPFSLRVRSELDDASGLKYGLGSSAAVVTATVTAILHFLLDEKPQKELLFRLATVAHVRTQGNGSAADIAASVYGGMIEYTSPQADWLLEADERATSITDLIEQDWPYASIKPISVPDNLQVCVGWTGSPASTFRLVDQLLVLKQTNRRTFDAFLTASEEAVRRFVNGLQANDVEEIYEGIEANRLALANVGEAAKVPVETPLLKQLSVDAHTVGGAGKLSGAGGGDCGIAFVTTDSQKEALFRLWEQSGIKPLSIGLTAIGATVE